MQKISDLPKPFIEKVEKLLDKDEIKDFKKSIITPPLKSIRINTLKANTKETIKKLNDKGIKLEEMPWYKYGFFVKDAEVSLGNTLEHFLGKFYVQDASSMLPILALDAKENESILDMAAAPGSKTTGIAMHMQNTGLIIANEPNNNRIKALQDNMERMGVLNTTITRNDGRFFKKMPDAFDKALIDAPCSSEGTIYKDPKVKYKWNQRMVNYLSTLQYALLNSAIISAKPKASILYSTCTISPEENEGVINKVLEKHNIKIEKLNFKGLQTSKGIRSYNNEEYNKEVEKCSRLWPHKSKTGGFFLCKIKKL